MYKIFTIASIFITFFSTELSAQAATVDFLRSTGKIYAVIAGIVILFMGIVVFLWRLDRKLTKLEKHINNE